MEKGKVSVIIPVYNVEKYIEKCMQSLFEQTYTNLEIILINDGSTDSSGELCDKFSQQDNRVKVIHKANGGVSSARNVGLDAATGEYIAFVDPDDWVEKDMYETIVNDFVHSGADAVFCGYWEDYEKETDLTPILHSPQKTGIVNGTDALYQCLIGMGYGYFTAVWNKVFKADFLKNINIKFENFAIAEDELWLAKVVPYCRNVYLNNTPFYHWMQSPNSALRGKGKYDKWYSALQAKQEVINAVKDDKRLTELSTAKVYNDIFDVVWNAYIDGKSEISKDFVKKLKPFEKTFYKSNDFSKLKRLRFWVLKILVTIHIPLGIVSFIGNINGYRVKEKINGI